MALNSVADLLDWVISFDAQKVRCEVDHLRRRYPNATTYELAERAFSEFIGRGIRITATQVIHFTANLLGIKTDDPVEQVSN